MRHGGILQKIHWTHLVTLIKLSQQFDIQIRSAFLNWTLWKWLSRRCVNVCLGLSHPTFEEDVWRHGSFLDGAKFIYHGPIQYWSIIPTVLFTVEEQWITSLRTRILRAIVLFALIAHMSGPLPFVKLLIILWRRHYPPCSPSGWLRDWQWPPTYPYSCVV
jgi:hypothetical protein